MAEEQQEDYIVIFEAPKIVPPEFRLYYDDHGKVLFYTCEKPEGQYIVIDAMTFAEARPDVRVIEGKLSRVSSAMIVSKLMPSQEGRMCAEEDLSVLVDSKEKIAKKYWKLKTYELE